MELMDRAALLALINDRNINTCNGKLSCLQMKRMVESVPTVDAVPVVHRHPVYHDRPAHYEHYEMVQQTENGEPLYKRQYYTLQDNPVAYCSECGKRLCSRFINFCPNCGAKMDGDTE